MNLEKELLDAFDRVVHEDYPNRRRINCPGSSALEKLAVAPDSDHPASILNHIRQCAPCFDEVRELRRKRIRQVSLGQLSHEDRQQHFRPMVKRSIETLCWIQQASI